MPPTDEDSAERGEFDLIQIAETDETRIYVWYPLNTTDRELRTRWIQFTGDDLAQLADYQ